MTKWAEKERPHFPRTFMDSQKLFKGSFRVTLNNKKIIRETYVTKSCGEKNGRSCRVWIFCVSCVHEDALCTLMIYHGGLMCHQLYHGTFLAENESKSALILNIHSNMHYVHSKFARIYFQIILGKRYLNLSIFEEKINFDIYKAG